MSNNGQEDLSSIEIFVSASGKKLEFELSVNETATGYTARAEETPKSKGKRFGYSMSYFSPNNPYLALGKLRHKIRRRISTHYLTEDKLGLSLTHDELIGSIDYCSDEDRIVIQADGKKVSMADLFQILSSYEGFEIKISIQDPGDDL